MRTITAREAAEITGTTVAAIYFSIKKGKLKATKNDKGYLINYEDFKMFLKRRYNRAYSLYEGKPRYDKTKGEYSVTEASEYLKVPAHWLYFLIRGGKMSYSKKGCSYILHIEEIRRIAKNYLA